MPIYTLRPSTLPVRASGGDGRRSRWKSEVPCWYSSVVERHLGKVEVQGSSPCTSFGGARHLAGRTGERQKAEGSRLKRTKRLRLVHPSSFHPSSFCSASSLMSSAGKSVEIRAEDGLDNRPHEQK